MRVRVDADLCQGHGSCNLACAEVFQFDEQGFACVVDERPPERLRDDLVRAEQNCPERAISLERSSAA